MTPEPGDPDTRDRRLAGIDLARALAVLAMMAAHLFPETVPTATGFDVSPVHRVIDGRSAALFAVLAGVSIALTTGRTDPRTRPWLPDAAALAGRAAVLAVLGLTLGVVSTNIAVILVNYGVLFLLAPAFLRLRPGALIPVAGVWAVAGPVVSHLLRRHWWPDGHWPGDITSWLSLSHPLQLTHEFLLTGYYPTLTWVPYLLAGLAVGRSSLLYRGRGLALLGVGSGLAGAAWAASALLLSLPAAGSLTAPEGSPLSTAPPELLTHLPTYGTAPTTSWWWLAAGPPHSGTPVDLAHTIGTSVAVIGFCLLLTSIASGRLACTPLTVAGAMPLTLYSAHVVWVALLVDPPPAATWLAQTVTLVLGACLYRAVAVRLGRSGRGPLELATSAAARTCAQAVHQGRGSAGVP